MFVCGGGGVEGADFVFIVWLSLFKLAKVSVSDKVEAISGAETCDVEEGEKEVQPSMEEGLTGEQKADDHSQQSGKHMYIHGP